MEPEQEHEEQYPFWTERKTGTTRLLPEYREKARQLIDVHFPGQKPDFRTFWEKIVDLALDPEAKSKEPKTQTPKPDFVFEVDENDLEYLSEVFKRRSNSRKYKSLGHMVMKGLRYLGKNTYGQLWAGNW